MLVVGAGGLGSPCILYLAGAGVGRIGICDKDTVDRSNLHRQVIHREHAIGERRLSSPAQLPLPERAAAALTARSSPPPPSAGAHKAQSAAAACQALNSSVRAVAHTGGLDPGNAVELVSGYDAVIDCSDNAPTRYLLNDACVAAGRPLVSGAAIGRSAGPKGARRRC